MGGRDGGRDAHFFAPFVGLVDAELALLGSEMSHCATAMSGSVALIFHIDGPSSSRRQALWTMRSRMASPKVGSPIASAAFSPAGPA